MAVKSSNMVFEGILVLMGKESPERFATSLLLFLMGDLLLTHEVMTMDDFIYYPENLLLPVILIMAVMAIIGPVLVGMYRKNESKGKLMDWEPKYIATLVIDMLITPSGGIVVMSLIAQKLGGFNDFTYLVILPFVLLAVSYFAMVLMNEGIKGVAEQIKKVKSELADAEDELKE